MRPPSLNFIGFSARNIGPQKFKAIAHEFSRSIGFDDIRPRSMWWQLALL